MKTETDLTLLVLSIVLFAIVSGTYAALQILSYSRSERNGDETDTKPTFADRLLEDPVRNYFTLGLARILAGGAVVLAAYRFGAARLFDAPLSTGFVLFIAAALLLPLAAAKLLSVGSPERFVHATRFVVYPLIYILKPFIHLMTGLLHRISASLVDALSFSVLPLKRRIELFGYKNGDEDLEEQQLMSSVFEFGDTKVREIMVPRIDMVALNVNMDVTEALDTMIEAGHSRFPVYDESIDKVIGVVHTKDLLKKIVAGEEFSLSDVRRDVYFVPEAKKIDDLLTEFRKRRIHIAIVVDEYGGTAGLITLEDVLEELVGDIQDEFDTEEEPIKVIDADTVLCNSRVRLDELNDSLGLDLADGDVDTLGGFLYTLIGRVPRVGEVFRRGHLEFKIHSVVRQRIDKVLIKGLSSSRGHLKDSTG